MSDRAARVEALEGRVYACMVSGGMGPTVPVGESQATIEAGRSHSTRASAGTVQQPYSFGIVCQSTGQLCSPAFETAVTTGGVLKFSYQVPATHCSSVILHVMVDGAEVRVLGPLGPLGQGPADTGVVDLGAVSPGTHVLSLQAEGMVGGCNTGGVSGWDGSGTIITSAISADRLSFFRQPVGVRPGQAQPVVVRVLQENGKVDRGFSGNVTLDLGSNPSEAVLGGTTTVEVIRGVATFKGVAVDQAGDGYTLVASAIGAEAATSAPFNVAPDVLEFVGTPAPARPGSQALKPLRVRVKTAAGKVDKSFAGSISLVVVSPVPGPVVVGPDVVSPVRHGVATFKHLVLSTGGEGLILRAIPTSGALSADSNPFSAPGGG